MNDKFFIILLYILFNKQSTITNGVYNLLFDNYYLIYHKGYISTLNYCAYPKSFFRILRVSGHFDKALYYIEFIKYNLYLSISKDNELIFSKNKNNNNLNLWKFIKIEQNVFVIRNYNNCYLAINKSKFICQNIPKKEAALIKLNKIYFEEKVKKVK